MAVLTAKLRTPALLAVIIQVLLLQPAAARLLLIKVADDSGDPKVKLDSVIIATNVGNKAVGTFKLSNPGTKPVTISKIVYDFRFSVTHKDEYGVGNVNKDDIRQSPVLSTCGKTKLPTTLAPGATLICPFVTRMNIYGGEVQIVARVKDPSQLGDDALANAPDLAFDTVTVPPLDSKLIVEGDTDTFGAKKQFKEAKNSAITCHDIECDENPPSAPGCSTGYCKVCGGQKAVAAKCKSIPICVAYDMESADCGYLKQAKGPPTTKKGFSSWVAV